MRPTCSRCGAVAADELAGGWSTESDPAVGGLRWLCPACTRTHVRSIEAKLAEEHW